MNPYSRRDMLKMMGAGLGSLGLASVLSAEGMLGSCAVRIFMNPSGADGQTDKIAHLRQLTAIAMGHSVMADSSLGWRCAAWAEVARRWLDSGTMGQGRI